MQRLLTAILILFAACAHGEAELEILRLKHRSADQVIEVLRPLLEQGGSISGVQDRIMVRASAPNRAELRRALAAIDTAPRRLMITVLQDNDIDAEGAGTAGRRARVWSSRGLAADRVAQQVQVIEGGRAFIQVGYSFPLALRQAVIGPAGAIVSEAVVYRDLGTGFYAAPQLNGERVTLEISPQHETLSAAEAGAVRSARLSTTVSGRLGEWIELGAANQDVSQEAAGAITYTSRGSLDTRRVLLKVEELP